MRSHGPPCKRWAITGGSYCVAHDPARQADRQRIMESAWAASRARMLRWGDLRSAVNQAIDQHGRPAFVKASGISTTVIGRMLQYDDEQPVKPETWAKLDRGIAALTSVSSEDIQQPAALRMKRYLSTVHERLEK